MLQERQEQEKLERLAKRLGITDGEMSELVGHYEIYEDENGYGFRTIQFDESSPKHILKKIKDLENGYQVFLSPADADL